jgi:DnaJ family protein A protein 2
MPSQRHHEMGDLIIKINVAWPEHIDTEKIALLEQVLPARKAIPQFPRNVTLEEVYMADLDPRQQVSMEDDAMDEEEGEPRVQCANQ